MTVHFTCGSILSEATPPPPNESPITKLRALIPGNSYLHQRSMHTTSLMRHSNITQYTIIHSPVPRLAPGLITNGYSQMLERGEKEWGQRSSTVVRKYVYRTK